MSANFPPTQNAAPARPWDATRVSMVQNGTDTITEHVSVAVILAGIRNGRWQKPVAHVKTRYLSALQAAKQQGDPDPYKTAKEAVHDIKKKLPGVLFSGEFSQRANEHIINHSGLLCLDLDNLEDGASLKLALANDDHVQACFDFANRLWSKSSRAH